jgi:hypothetical protein
MAIPKTPLSFFGIPMPSNFINFSFLTSAIIYIPLSGINIF